METGKTREQRWFSGFIKRIVAGEDESFKLPKSLLASALYFGSLTVALIGPLGGLIYIFQHPSLSVVEKVSNKLGTEEILTLTPCGRTALLALVAATFLLSAVVGGIGRALLKPRFTYGWVVALGGLSLIWGITHTLDQFRRISASIASVDKGDNLEIAAFITFWALMIGYSLKATWDELRDRLAGRIADLINTAGNDTKTVLDEAATLSVRMMLSKIAEQDVFEIYEVVGQVGPIADLAAEAMHERNIDL